MQQASVRLEALGFDVGYRYIERSTKDRARLSSTLDIIKYLCKDFWLQIFRKQVDMLQTNHKGVFVMQDLNFRWLRYFSSHNDEDTNRQAAPFIVFPCGLIRGALANLGISATVQADVGLPNHPNLLACKLFRTVAILAHVH